MGISTSPLAFNGVLSVGDVFVDDRAGGSCRGGRSRRIQIVDVALGSRYFHFILGCALFARLYREHLNFLLEGELLGNGHHLVGEQLLVLLLGEPSLARIPVRKIERLVTMEGGRCSDLRSIVDGEWEGEGLKYDNF